MLDIAEALLAALDAGESVPVVTVTRVLGSAPRPVGASLAARVVSDGSQPRLLGAISGGCAEARGYELACGLQAGVPQVEDLGFDEWAFATGLSCGGQLRVLAQRLDATRAVLIDQLRAAAGGRGAAFAMVSRGPQNLLGKVVTARDSEVDLPNAVLRQVRDALGGNDGRCTVIEVDDDLEFALLALLPRPHLVIVGALDAASAVSRLAHQLGYRVSVVDARGLFATAERFPEADEIVVTWPSRYLETLAMDARTVIVTLSHEERFDIPALAAALAGPAGYVGAMGSRSTHARRVRLLIEAGVPPESVARLHSPIGLDLGASTPMETAVSIMAEVIAARTDSPAAPLRLGTEPIHARAVSA